MNNVADKIVKSNERLAESSGRHVRTMTRLTVALLAFATVEAIAAAIPVLRQLRHWGCASC